MSEYLDFLEACEYLALADLATEQEAARLSRRSERTWCVRSGSWTERVPHPLVGFDCAGDMEKKDSLAQAAETWYYKDVESTTIMEK